LRKGFLVDQNYIYCIIFSNSKVIRENILKIKERVNSLCRDRAVDPSGITIVAVSKNRSVNEIKEVVGAGILDIGENRLQEAKVKLKELKNYNIRWHMVGHLQTNKVKDAVEIFDLIQSVDILRLAEKIDKYAQKINKIQEILIEVKTSPEPTKFGIEPENVLEFIKDLTDFKNIKVRGLMTIAPYFDDPEKTRPYFKMLREIKEAVEKEIQIPFKLDILSMGMTDDFEVAIQEGSNMLRLGRAIFEAR